MADEVPIQGTGEIAKIRNPLGVIGLAIITCGIYTFIWWYQVNREMADIGKARGTTELGDNPQNSLLAFVPGFCAIVPPYISVYNGSGRLRAAQRLFGIPEGTDQGLMLVLFIFIGPVAMYLFQNELNQVLQAQAGGAAQIPPTQAPPAAQPGQAPADTQQEPPPQPPPQQEPPQQPPPQQ
jgi:hypothetical protein